MGSCFPCVSKSTLPDVEYSEGSDWETSISFPLSNKETFFTVETPVLTRDSMIVTPSLKSTTTESSSCYVPIPMTKVLPHLYLGTYDDANDELQLSANKITHILSLIGRKNILKTRQYKQVPMHDYGRTNLKEVLEKVTKFVEEGQQDGHNLLIHCYGGQNRSATVVIALQIINQRKTLYNAHMELKRIRPIVQINVDYARQLVALEKKILGRSSLPHDWMEIDKVEAGTGFVTYKYENLNPIWHRPLAFFLNEE